jgi:hypothetical protein
VRTFLLTTIALGLLASAATAAPEPRSATVDAGPVLPAPKPLLALKAPNGPHQKRPTLGREHVLLALKAPPL